MPHDEPEHVHDENCIDAEAMALIGMPLKLVPVLLSSLQLAIELSERLVLDGHASVEDIIEQVTDVKELLSGLLSTLGIDPNEIDKFISGLDNGDQT